MRDESQLLIRSLGELNRLGIQPSQGEVLNVIHKVGEDPTKWQGHERAYIKTSLLFASFCGFTKQEEDYLLNNIEPSLQVTAQYASAAGGRNVNRNVNRGVDCPITYMAVSDYTVAEFSLKHQNLLSEYAQKQLKLICEAGQGHSKLNILLRQVGGPPCKEYLLPEAKVVAVLDSDKCLTREMRAWLKDREVLVVSRYDAFASLAEKLVRQTPYLTTELCEFLPEGSCESTPLDRQRDTLRRSKLSKEGHIRYISPVFSEGGKFLWYENK